jgi:hypothetical protein
MDPKSLTRDFSEFLQCLNAHGVEYFKQCYPRRIEATLGGVPVGFLEQCAYGQFLLARVHGSGFDDVEIDEVLGCRCAGARLKPVNDFTHAAQIRPRPSSTPVAAHAGQHLWLRGQEQLANLRDIGDAGTCKRFA